MNLATSVQQQTQHASRLAKEYCSSHLSGFLGPTSCLKADSIWIHKISMHTEHRGAAYRLQIYHSRTANADFSQPTKVVLANYYPELYGGALLLPIGGIPSGSDQGAIKELRA